MTDLMAMLPFLGRSARDPALVDIFKNIGIDLANELNLIPDYYRGHIERPNEGLCFAFTDEAWFLGRRKQPVGQGALYFTGLFAFSEDRDGYRQYQGELPFGINFSHERSDLVALLGVPSWQRVQDDGSIPFERWDNKAVFYIHVTYYLPSKRPAVFSLHLPDAPFQD